jgi:hypothetical protein
MDNEAYREINKARLAMLLDCEGTIQLSKSRNSTNIRGYQHHMGIQIANTDIRLIKWVKDNFGFTIGINSGSLKGGSKVCYNATLSSKKASTLLKDLRKYIIVKDRQADLAIAMQETFNSLGGSKVFDEVYNLRDKIYEESRLNNEVFILVKEEDINPRATGRRPAKI